MSLDLSKAAGVVLAALVSAAVWLFVLGVPEAVAGRAPLYEHERFPTAPVTGTDVIASIVLVAASICAGVVYYVLSTRRERRASRSQAAPRAIRSEDEQKRKAA